MRILLTGATGFIGRHLLTSLAQRHEVIAVGRRPPADDVRWVSQDLAAPLDVTALPARVDAVIHLAQSEHYKRFPERADDIFAVNVQSTFRLLEWARAAGASHFIYTSTGGVYGSGDAHLSEADPVSPIDFYVRSKYAAELMVAAYAHLMTTVILRLFFVYGPGQERMLIPTLAARVHAGDEVVVAGDPGLRINPIHVDDAVRVFEPALALDRSELINVAGSEPVTLTELVTLLAELDGHEPSLRHDLSASPAGDLIGDNARMREVLGITPEIPLRDGLTALLAGL